MYFVTLCTDSLTRSQTRSRREGAVVGETAVSAGECARAAPSAARRSARLLVLRRAAGAVRARRAMERTGARRDPPAARTRVCCTPAYMLLCYSWPQLCHNYVMN